jgi:hypothetical protein
MGRSTLPQRWEEDQGATQPARKTRAAPLHVFVASIMNDSGFELVRPQGRFIRS